MDTTHLLLQCKPPGGSWDTIGATRIGTEIGATDRARSFLTAQRERFKRLEVLHPQSEFRIVAGQEPAIASAAVTLVALAVVFVAVALFAGLRAGVI